MRASTCGDAVRNSICLSGSPCCCIRKGKLFLKWPYHMNKAGYPATSYGRVGRGGNARFLTFRLDHYGRTDGRTKPLIELRVRN